MITHHDHSSVLTAKEAAAPEHREALIARFGEKAYRLWCDARHPQRLLAPTSIGTAADAEGCRISIALGMYGEIVAQTDFDAEGCPSAKIAAAAAAHWAMGRTLDEVAAMDEAAIVATLGDFPQEARRHARLAGQAVRAAAARWQARAN